jgi:ribosomal protein S6--L-glutamate ligase
MLKNQILCPVNKRIQQYEQFSSATMILSFHPLYVADRNLLCAGRDPGAPELAAIREATAVILPQGCRESLYRMAKNNCTHVFPDYDARFAYPEKIGQAKLFQKQSVPHPSTVFYENGASMDAGYDALLKNPPFNPPFVFKFNWGGEGETVFCIHSWDAFETILEKSILYEKSGQYGFLIQEFVPSKKRSLRVVVIHESCISYWRVQDDADGFYTNLTKGAKIDAVSDPALQKTAIAATRAFCDQTKINLAGFDFLFSESDLAVGTIKPLFLEINYFFGRKGLGGSEKYYKILQNEIDAWITRIQNGPIRL